MSATQVAKDQLKSFIERVERLEGEKAEIASDIRDVYLEAKSNGYDVRALREIVKLRKQDAGERRTHDAIVDTYKAALGMIADLPLGEAAIARAVASPSVRNAVKNLGTPVELTDDEKAKGYSAAFMKGDTRMTIGLGGDVAKPKARAAPASRPDDKLTTPPIPIPAHQPVAQVGPSAGIRSAPPEDPRPDGVERPPFTDPMPFQQAAAPGASAPPAPSPGLGGADDLLEIPGFLRRTADNRVPA